jgi:uncharacterized damage-inducible protein DinB
MRQVSGRMDNGPGDLFGEEDFEGRKVRLRFRWQRVSDSEARWEQAYFDEERAEWETNWTMRFTRQRESADQVETFHAASDFIASLDAQAIYMTELAAAMPEDRYRTTPAAGTRTFVEQLLHAADGLVNMVSVASGAGIAANSDASGTSRADAMALVASAFEQTRIMAGTISDQSFDARVPWQSRVLDQSTISVRQVLATARDHLAHHRGQLIVYLRMNGITPPVYVGF